MTDTDKKSLLTHSISDENTSVLWILMKWVKAVGTGAACCKVHKKHIILL